MWYLVLFVGGGATGAMVYRAVIDGLMLAQEETHKKKMAEAFEEIKRLRAQVALHIGKE